ncbi:hypothetical protein D3C84_812460 [compost metagenome]
MFPSRYRTPYDDILLARILREQHIESGQQGHKQRDIHLPRQRPDPIRQHPVDPEAHAASLEALHIGPWEVCRQLQKRNPVTEYRHPVVSVRLQRLPISCTLLPCRIILILDWECSKLLSLIQRSKLLRQKVKRHPIRDHVMHIEQKQLAAGLHGEQTCPKKRSLRQIERSDEPPQHRLFFLSRCMNRFDSEWHLFLDLLHDSAVLHQECCPQRFMAEQDRSKRSIGFLKIKSPLYS